MAAACSPCNSCRAPSLRLNDRVSSLAAALCNNLLPLVHRPRRKCLQCRATRRGQNFNWRSPLLVHGLSKSRRPGVQACPALPALAPQCETDRYRLKHGGLHRVTRIRFSSHEDPSPSAARVPDAGHHWRRRPALPAPGARPAGLRLRLRLPVRALHLAAGRLLAGARAGRFPPTADRSIGFYNMLAKSLRRCMRLIGRRDLRSSRRLP